MLGKSTFALGSSGSWIATGQTNQQTSATYEGVSFSASAGYSAGVDQGDINVSGTATDNYLSYTSASFHLDNKQSSGSGSIINASNDSVSYGGSGSYSYQQATANYGDGEDSIDDERSYNEQGTYAYSYGATGTFAWNNGQGSAGYWQLANADAADAGSRSGSYTDNATVSYDYLPGFGNDMAHDYVTRGGGESYSNSYNRSLSVNYDGRGMGHRAAVARTVTVPAVRAPVSTGWPISGPRRS